MINYKKKDAYIRSLYSYITILVSNAIQNSRWGHEGRRMMPRTRRHAPVRTVIESEYVDVHNPSDLSRGTIN